MQSDFREVTRAVKFHCAQDLLSLSAVELRNCDVYLRERRRKTCGSLIEGAHDMGGMKAHPFQARGLVGTRRREREESRLG